MIDSKAIQGLRGIAIIFIVLCHLDGRLDLGGLGVSLFLGISGMLNEYKIVHTQTAYSFKYIIRRILGFYLLYVLATMITACYFSASKIYGVTSAENMVVFIMNLLMVQTFVPDPVYYGAFTQVGWFIPLTFTSLLLTGQFGKIWRKFKKRSCIIILCVGWISCAVLSFAVSEWQYGIWLMYASPYIRIFDFFFAGCVFQLTVFNMDRNGKSLLIDIMALSMFPISVLIMIITVRNGYTIYYYNLIWLLPTWIILYGIQRGKILPRILASRPLTIIGDHSLEIFLTHLIIIHFVDVIMSGYNGYVGLMSVKLLAIIIICPIVKKVNDVMVAIARRKIA